MITVIHAIRRHLIAVYAFSPPSEGNQEPQQQGTVQTITAIGVEVWQAIPVVFKKDKRNPWEAEFSGDGCAESFFHGVSAGLNQLLSGIPVPRKLYRREVLKSSCLLPAKTVVIATHKPYSKGHGVFIKGTFIPPPTYGKNEELCNVTQACKLCSCGQILYYLITDKALAPGTELVAREHGLHLRDGRYLVAQFDGSCHFAGTAYAAAGCGVVLWRIADLIATPLVQMSIPLHQARSAPQSEACGSAYAVQIIAKWLENNPEEEFDSITIQGDNLSIISNWIGSGRLKQNEMHALLENAYRIVRYQLSNIHWEYIPGTSIRSLTILRGKRRTLSAVLEENS